MFSNFISFFPLAVSKSYCIELDEESAFQSDDLTTIVKSDSFKEEPKKYFLIYASNYFNCCENKSEIMVVLNKFTESLALKNAVVKGEVEATKAIKHLFEQATLYANPNYSRSQDSYVSGIL